MSREQHRLELLRLAYCKMEIRGPIEIDEGSLTELPGKPCKIMDAKGRKRVGVVARGLKDLMDRAHTRLNIPPETPIRVVLEDDGTEVEDEEYFNTLEINTAFVILVGDETWLPGFHFNRIGFDQPDSEQKPPAPHLEKLVDQIYSDLTCITLFGGKELELLANMDPDCVSDLVPEEDTGMLGTVREASFRFLTEKEEAKEALELLKLYHCRHVAERNRGKKEE